MLIDADPQSDLTSCLAVRPQDDIPVSLPTLFNFALNRSEYISTQGAIIKHDEGVHFIPSNLDLSATEISLYSVKDRGNILKKIKI